MPALLNHPGPVTDDATRREFLVGGAALTALLAGCGSPTATSTPGGAAGFPLTLAGKEGTATIPAPPVRVVTVGYQRDTDTVLALGVAPVATVAHSQFLNGVAPWVESKLSATMPELLDATTGLPFEKIAGLAPDLIVATDDYELADNYARLTRIAPTVSYVDGPESDTWQQRTTHVGAALGRAEQAEKLVTEIMLQVMAAAEANPRLVGATFSRCYVSEGEIRALTRPDASVTLLEQLGLKLSPQFATLPQADTPGRGSVSPENLGVLDADVMLVSYPSDTDRTFLESNPLFGRLAAVRDGRYIVLDNPVSLALAFPSALSIPYGLDRAVAAITEALA